MKKSFSRGTALVAGTAMLLINGVVYAWSIYSSPFVEGFGWSSAKLGVCFTVMLGSFCLGGVIGGAVANWRGVRVSVPAGQAYDGVVRNEGTARRERRAFLSAPCKQLFHFIEQTFCPIHLHKGLLAVFPLYRAPSARRGETAFQRFRRALRARFFFRSQMRVI